MAKHLLRLLKDRALEKLKDEGSLLQSYIHTRDSVGGLWIGKLGGGGSGRGRWQEWSAYEQKDTK